MKGSERFEWGVGGGIGDIGDRDTWPIRKGALFPEGIRYVVVGIMVTIEYVGENITKSQSKLNSISRRVMTVSSLSRKAGEDGWHQLCVRHRQCQKVVA